MQSITFEDVEDEYTLATKVLPLVPSAGEYDINFDLIDCTAEGPSVSVLTDAETNMDVLEISDNSRVSFPITCNYRYLALHLKNMEKFVAVTILVKCTAGKVRELTLSNRRSNIIIQENTAAAPMKLGEGWQYLNLDIQQLIYNAFGSEMETCICVSVHGSARMSKLYFQEKEYADAELPPYLRLIQ